MTKQSTILTYKVKLNDLYSSYVGNIERVHVHVVGNDIWIDMTTNVVYNGNNQPCGAYFRDKEHVNFSMQNASPCEWNFPNSEEEQLRLLCHHWGVTSLQKEHYLEDVIRESLTELIPLGYDTWWKIGEFWRCERRYVMFCEQTTNDSSASHPMEAKYGTRIADLRKRNIHNVWMDWSIDLIFMCNYWNVNFEDEPYLKEVVENSLEELTTHPCEYWVIVPYHDKPFYDTKSGRLTDIHPFYEKYNDMIKTLRHEHKIENHVHDFYEVLTFTSTVVSIGLLIMYMLSRVIKFMMT